MSDQTQMLQKPMRHSFFAPKIMKSALQKFFVEGALVMLLPDGKRLKIGTGVPTVTAHIHDWKTVWQIIFNADLHIGEAYMDGRLTFSQGDIYQFLDLCLRNLGRGKGLWIRRAQQRIRMLCRRMMMHNPIAKSQKNVAHHYDLSDQMYELFLDDDRQYSCAYYKNTQDSLEQAQAAKKQHIADKLLLESGQKVLDIGCGWGGLDHFLAKSKDADVTGLTLSKEQLHYAEQQTEKRGLLERVRFLLKDYRQEKGSYDRIVSVGMFEHLGVGYFDQYFTKINELLKQDGIALIHTIGCANPPSSPHPWIAKYIFPGGYIPSLSEIMPSIERSGLIVTDIEVLRLHYAKTLQHWRQRFMQNRDKIKAIYDDRFCRMWEFYLAACEAGFRHSGLVVFQIQLAKKLDSVPLTRDYLHNKTIEAK